MNDLQYTARQALEIKGSFLYFIAVSFISVVAVFFSVIANVSMTDIIKNIGVILVGILLSFFIYSRKKQLKPVRLLSYAAGITTLMVPLLAKYLYAHGNGWTFAAQSYNTSIYMVFFVISLQWLFDKKVYITCALFAFFNWVIFLLIASHNGANFSMLAVIDGKPVTDGVIVFREIFFLVVSGGMFYISYRNIPILNEYDKNTTDQRQKIERQAALQREIAGDIKKRMNSLCSEVDGQYKLLNRFNIDIQNQAATFEEMSSTLEELLGSAENIHAAAAGQVESNEKIESIINDFRTVKQTTKENLSETLGTLERITVESGKSNKNLGEVEKTIFSIQEQSTRIRETVSIILDIADRINLLSLNAAIEAARAGESGRGFAVVADEIGKLAYKTSESIKDIEQVLKQNARITEDGVKVIGRATGSVKGLVNDMSDSSGKIKALQESILVEEDFINIIIEHMLNNMSLSKNIGTSTDEQKNAIQSTSQAIEHVNQIVGRMVTEVQNIADLSEKMLENANALLKRSEEVV